MGKLIVITQNSFANGISDDIRSSSPSSFAMTKHLDIFSSPNRLIPYRSLEQDDTSVDTYFVRDFKYASASAKLYGLGQTGAGLTKIVYKADATANGWTVPASSEGNGAVKNGCFAEYKDYFWGFQGTNQVFKWGLLSGTPSITNSVKTLAATITSVADGVIAKDDNLYMAYNNIIIRVPATGTVEDEVLTIPSNLKITSLTNYGNYLAIACSPSSSFNGTSKVFLWNLTSDDVQESIDWGEGDLRVLENVEGGFLVGITDRYLNNSVGAGKGSMIIQVYSGGVPQVVKEIFTQALTGKTIPTSKAVRNNRLFWSAKIMDNSAGTAYTEGLWSFGRKNVNYGWAVTCDIIDENVSTAGIQGFGIAGNFFFLAHSNDGSIDKTNDSAVYAFTSSLETQILNFGDYKADKRLKSFEVAFSPILTSQSLTVKMKVDSDTSWTTIGTFATVGKVSRTFLNIESTGLAFPSGREFRFLLESSGGLEITEWTAIGEILTNPL